MSTLPEVIFADPQAPSRAAASNKHVSVTPEGDHVIDLEFVEEPLGIMAEQGHGFIRIEFGDTIGPNNRYRVVRKLGWGMNSSVWMAFDLKEQRYVAIKALKGYATNLVTKRKMWELDALQAVAYIPPPSDIEPNHCPRLLASFTHPGKDHGDGDHLCLVTDVMGGDVGYLQDNGVGKEPLPLPLVKRILLHALHGLAHMHHCNIAHADFKPDNIMFDTGPMTTDDVEMLMKKDPSRRHPPEESWECVVQTAVSQPLPLPSLSEAMTRNYVISDFGSAKPITLRTTDEITPLSLRAPEIILQGRWDTKVDIWAFGCLIFELITGRRLFKHEPFLKYSLDAPTTHLWQMLSFTQEKMTREQINSSKLGDQYFIVPDDPEDPFCTLRAHQHVPMRNRPFASSLRNYKVLEEGDVLDTADIMKRCLQLNPKNRVTAIELLQDPWWHKTAES